MNGVGSFCTGGNIAYPHMKPYLFDTCYSLDELVLKGGYTNTTSEIQLKTKLVGLYEFFIQFNDFNNPLQSKPGYHRKNHVAPALAMAQLQNAVLNHFEQKQF